MKPKTGFELILNYSSQCNEKKLKNDSSAGANAASRVNTKFSACDPLSEIVWSPDKGYSLKCVDSSFTNKNISLFQDVEPSSMVLALLQSVTCTTDKPIDDVFVQPLAVICAKSNVSSSDTPLAHENRDHRLLQPHKDQDQKLKNSFKSYFKSTHCQSVENFGTIMSHQEEDDAGASLQLQIRPINFLNSHEDLKNNTLENENCYNMVLSKEKEGVALHSPSRQNKNNNENVESLELYERKEIGHKNDTTEDLWITRFSPKSIVSDNLTERGGFQTTSTYFSMLTEKHISHLNNCKVEETKEQSGDNKLLSEAKSLKNCCIDKEASICPKVEKKNNDHISKYKVNHVTPFKRLSNYEPMVSMFARRLGAIKQCQQN